MQIANNNSQQGCSVWIISLNPPKKPSEGNIITVFHFTELETETQKDTLTSHFRAETKIFLTPESQHLTIVLQGTFSYILFSFMILNLSDPLKSGAK